MANKSLRETTSPDFARLVAEERPVLSDFYATWCGPCKAMEPIVERLAERFAGRAEIVKVNIDHSPDLAAQYGIRGVPTLLLFAGGQVVERLVGPSSERSLTALIEAHVGQIEPVDDSVAA